jgi:hypothetical protein
LRPVRAGQRTFSWPAPAWASQQGVETGPAGLTVDFRRVEYDVEAAARGILASELPHEFAAQFREARGFRAQEA